MNLEKSGIKIVKLLQSKNHQAFFVGGIVRNMLLKRESDNIDMATDATPDQVEKILKNAGYFTKAVGKKFGTILVIEKKAIIEITTFRSEGRYSDNRHPNQVQFIKDYLADAKRRDFTINALYYDPIKKQIFDPTNGQEDLKRKLIKFVGDPKKRIDEDALRMLRAVRLATQLGFKLEKNSFAAIKTRAKYIQEISVERVRDEFEKILKSDKAAEGIRLLQDIGLLKFIIPEFEKLKNVFHHSKTYHLEGDVATHIIKAVEILEIKNLTLSYATLFHDVGKVMKPQKVFEGKDWKYTFWGHVQLSGEIFEKFAKKFRISNEIKSQAKFLIAEHDNRKQFIESKPETQIKFMLKQEQPELLVELWRVDSGANLRLEKNQRVWGKSAVKSIAERVIGKIHLARRLFHLAKGEMIMKYSKLKPGRDLGRKVEDVKVQIVLGKIKDEKDLAKYLGSS